MTKTQTNKQTKVEIKIDNKALAEAHSKISKTGHACRYLRIYPAIAQALEALEKEGKTFTYSEDIKTGKAKYLPSSVSRENCRVLCRAIINTGLVLKSNKQPYSVETLCDVVKCYFRDTRGTDEVISKLVGKDTQKQVLSFLCVSKHKTIREEAKKAEEQEAKA